jgi:uncharacterized membrane protein HdeD (DUF308 family)
MTTQQIISIIGYNLMQFIVISTKAILTFLFVYWFLFKFWDGIASYFKKIKKDWKKSGIIWGGRVG